jgi:NAD(P)-dependent dehydrogenase (short-subunit alcohol dehydrogenase family)
MSQNKYVLITGATSGIGLETAKNLLDKGYIVIGTSRSDEKEKSAIEYLNKKILFIRADLSSQLSTRNLAKKTKQIIGEDGLDVLINNAGTFYSYYALSSEGVEMQFSVNAIAPFYLSLLLYDELKKAKGRIVNVNSNSHYNTKVKFSDLQLSKKYGQLKAYKHTKLLSVMLSREFNKKSNDVRTYLADPGLVNTEMGFKNTSKLAELIWKHRKKKGQPLSVGASTSTFLATQQSLHDNLYWKYSTPKAPNKNALDDEGCKRIWDYCQNICNIDADKILGV